MAYTNPVQDPLFETQYPQPNEKAKPCSPKERPSSIESCQNQQSCSSDESAQNCWLGFCGIVSKFLLMMSDFFRGAAEGVRHYFSSNRYGASPSTWINGVNIPSHDEASQITLMHLKQMNQSSRFQTSTKFNLEHDIEMLEQFCRPEGFWKRIESLPDELLKQATVVHLKLGQKELEHILAPNEKIAKIQILELHGKSNWALELLRTRLNFLDPAERSDVLQTSSIASICTLDGEEITQSMKSLPSEFFYFLSMNQLKEIDLSGIVKEQAHFLLTGLEKRGELSQLPPDKLVHLIGFLHSDWVKLIPSEKIPKIDWKRVSQNDLNQFFSVGEISEIKKRLSSLTAKQFAELAPRFSAHVISCTPIQFLTELDFKALPIDSIHALFPSTNLSSFTNNISSNREGSVQRYAESERQKRQRENEKKLGVLNAQQRKDLLALLTQENRILLEKVEKEKR